MKIVFDIDNTLFHNDVVDNVCKNAGVDRPTDYGLDSLPKKVKDECYSKFTDVDIMCSLKPFSYAIGIDKKLKDAGHEMIAVTARSENLTNGTTKMINKYFPHIDKVIVVSDGNKAKVFDEYKPDVIIDDNSEYVEQGISVGVPYVFMVSNDVTTYNYKEILNVLDKGATVVNNVSVLSKFFGIK